ncbi:hypothetical protein NDU88_006225 [Pleurodeles waltl]|uniref:Uncharacterized protein n=1 Tax=Pleurodeles waltl TaxID=8319 RepID=A0AAV7NSU2_PLEWA|nr:hypothetical protein NDU88_006225 [Pleurodeles waltl]
MVTPGRSGSLTSHGPRPCPGRGGAGLWSRRAPDGGAKGLPAPSVVWISTWLRAQVAPPHLLSYLFFPAVVDADTAQAPRSPNAEEVVGPQRGPPPARGDRPESPRFSRIRPSSGCPPRGSPEAPGGAKPQDADAVAPVLPRRYSRLGSLRHGTRRRAAPVSEVSYSLEWRHLLTAPNIPEHWLSVQRSQGAPGHPVSWPVPELPRLGHTRSPSGSPPRGSPEAPGGSVKPQDTASVAPALLRRHSQLGSLRHGARRWAAPVSDVSYSLE